MLLNQQSHLEVVGEASTLQEAMPIARRENPEVILYVNEEIRESDSNSMARLGDVAPNTKLLIVTDIDHLDQTPSEMAVEVVSQREGEKLGVDQRDQADRLRRRTTVEILPGFLIPIQTPSAPATSLPSHSLPANQ